MTLNINLKEKNDKFDFLKWLIVAILLLAGIVFSAYFASQPVALRLIAWLIIGMIVVIFAFQTTQGRKFWYFCKEAKIELRKVVWPTRQETIQTTFLVITLVVLASLCLWGIDSIFLWLVGLLTGQRG